MCVVLYYFLFKQEWQDNLFVWLTKKKQTGTFDITMYLHKNYVLYVVACKNENWIIMVKVTMSIMIIMRTRFDKNQFSSEKW